MPDGSQHLSDEEILQFIDNELPASRAKRLHEHVAACPKCRERQASIEGTLNNLSEFYISERTESGSMAARSRTLLQEQLMEDRKRHSFWRRCIAVGYLPLPIAAAIVLVFIGLAFYGEKKIWIGKPSVLSP